MISSVREQLKVSLWSGSTVTLMGLVANISTPHHKCVKVQQFVPHTYSPTAQTHQVLGIELLWRGDCYSIEQQKVEMKKPNSDRPSQRLFSLYIIYE